MAAFARVKNELDSGAVQKMVLSRIRAAKADRNAIKIFEALNQTYPATFNYIISSAQTGTWLGATPELLLRKENQAISSVSLAGTRPSNGFTAWTTKEKKEQEYVTAFILQVLAQNGCTSIAAGGPFTYTAGPVQHLKTDISATINEHTSLVQLLQDMHPTPATCGIPKQKAKDKIIAIEQHRRKFYTGYIGILSKRSQVFYVNLRCMELLQDRALLYVGGGITAESVAEKEWDETERKAVTLLNVLH